MKNQKSRKRIPALLFAGMLLMLLGSFVSAEEGEYYDDDYYYEDVYSPSSDDSLSSLGISTPIVSIEPEFYYSTVEYQVVVPAGTEYISLDPTPSDANAYVSDISGTDLDDNGETTVEITVTAEAGNSYTYYLYVTSEDGGAALRAVMEAAAAAETEVQTEPPTEEETETETEDSRYVSVARETLEEAENTIDALKEETTLYRDRGNMLLRIMYVLIAICVVLLFIVINLLLRNREIRSELNDFRGMDYSADQEVKEKSGEQEPLPRQEPEEQPGEASREEPPEETGEEEESPVMDDDPTKVPKPTDAREQPKQMPKYETPQQQAPYEPPKEKKDKEKKDESVDVEYIDL